MSGSSGCGAWAGQLEEAESVASTLWVIEGAKAGGGEAVDDGVGSCPDEESFIAWVSFRSEENVG